MQLNVVIVDDSEINLTLFKHLVNKIEGLIPLAFDNSQKALDWCTQNEVDVIIVDYMMPAPDGLEFIRLFRALEGKQEIPVIMITANDLKEIRYSALEIGATDFLIKPVDKSEFTARIRNISNLRRSQKLLADRAALLAEEVRLATLTVLDRERETILRLSRAAEYRDPETGGHILRMAHYSRLIAQRLGLSQEEQQMVLEVAPMHDIGKVGISDYILLKPGAYTPEEFAIMKRHTEIGHQILHNSSSSLLQAGAIVALTHHEKYDGSGYPKGLKGEEIPLHGRIVAVADVFDALTSSRPYKLAWELDAARDFLVKNSGILSIRQRFNDACL